MNPRRNIYPMDASDPNLRWCNTCEFPYMPAGGCDTHEGRCLTCCAAAQDSCLIGMTTERFRVARRAITEQERARVQRDIDALYGPQEDSNA